MTTTGSYMTRAMQSSDPRFGRILSALGSPQPAAKLKRKGSQHQADDMTALRVEYQAVTGKRAFHGWDAHELRERIAAAGE